MHTPSLTDKLSKFGNVLDKVHVNDWKVETISLTSVGYITIPHWVVLIRALHSPRFSHTQDWFPAAITLLRMYKEPFR